MAITQFYDQTAVQGQYYQGQAQPKQLLVQSTPATTMDFSRQQDALVPYVPQAIETINLEPPQSALTTSPYSSPLSTMRTSYFSRDSEREPEQFAVTAYSAARPRDQYPIVPNSTNSIGSDSVHPDKFKMKKRRKRRTVGGAVGGAIVGGLALGPVGAVVGAPIGAYATNKIHKARERKSQRRHEKIKFQEAASRSQIHRAIFA
jgi:hypothetical protein